MTETGFFPSTIANPEKHSSRLSPPLCLVLRDASHGNAPLTSTSSARFVPWFRIPMMLRRD